MSKEKLTVNEITNFVESKFAEFYPPYKKQFEELIKSYARQCCNQTLYNVGIGMSESYYYPEEIQK